MGVPDEDLMLAYAGGDAAAFEALYKRHKAGLYGFVVRSVRSRGEAEELFQEIWMRVIESRMRYAPTARFATWLYTIAHNRLVDHWRARGLSLVSLDDEEGGAPEPAAGPGAEPERTALGREAVARLLQALGRLPLAQREAFLLHHEGGLGTAQIAAATGTNEEAAKSRLRYAMNKLREAMGDE
jgi:RNA polymerase sigma-70 factor (ECF subfamily)